MSIKFMSSVNNLLKDFWIKLLTFIFRSGYIFNKKKIIIKFSRSRDFNDYVLAEPSVGFKSTLDDVRQQAWNLKSV